jgi:hypothetical protein
MNEITPDILHEDLIALRDALDLEDFSQAGDVLAWHDMNLRHFVAVIGGQFPLQALQELLKLHRRLDQKILACRIAATRYRDAEE